MTVLIVGQSALARLVLPLMVRALDVNLICATDALSAAHVLSRTRLDLIIVDAQMKHIDAAGFLALKQQDARFADTPAHVLHATGATLSTAQLLGIAGLMLDEIGGARGASLDRLIALLGRVEFEARSDTEI